MRNSPWRTGSIHQASMQAVKRGFLTRWSYNGLSCTISPRATLTRMASSFMRASSAAPIRPRVARVSGALISSTSAASRSSLSRAGVPIQSTPSFVRPCRLMACTRMPTPCISRPVAAPMPPKPKIPQTARKHAVVRELVKLAKFDVFVLQDQALGGGKCHRQRVFSHRLGVAAAVGCHWHPLRELAQRNEVHATDHELDQPRAVQQLCLARPQLFGSIQCQEDAGVAQRFGAGRLIELGETYNIACAGENVGDDRLTLLAQFEGDDERWSAKLHAPQEVPVRLRTYPQIAQPDNDQNVEQAKADGRNHLSCGDHRTRSSMLVHAADSRGITLDRNFQNPFPATRNDTIEIMAIDRIELKRLQRGTNSSHLFCGERDQIRIAAHEAEEFSVCRHRRDIG